MVAVHSTARGPALGGCRMWTYDDARAAVRDVLRLSRAMTFKAAVAGLPLGGGKGVIMLRPDEAVLTPERREAVLQDFGDTVEALGGDYLTAEDVGTSERDMEVIASRTKHVTGLASGSGDPSPWTALGCEVALRVTCERAFGTDDLNGRRVAVIGLGSVGGRLAEMLPEGGAELVVADVDQSKRELAERLGAEWTDPLRRMTADVDVVAPCALGGVLNDETVPALRCKAIAGAANNQLAADALDAALAARGILWAPDFVCNAGGIINIGVELEPDGYSPERADTRVRAVGDTLREIFDSAAASRHDAAAGRARDRPRAPQPRSRPFFAQLLEVRAQRDRGERAHGRGRVVPGGVEQLVLARSPAASASSSLRSRSARCARYSSSLAAGSVTSSPWPGWIRSRSSARSRRSPSRYSRSRPLTNTLPSPSTASPVNAARPATKTRWSSAWPGTASTVNGPNVSRPSRSGPGARRRAARAAARALGVIGVVVGERDAAGAAARGDLGGDGVEVRLDRRPWVDDPAGSRPTTQVFVPESVSGPGLGARMRAIIAAPAGRPGRRATWRRRARARPRRTTTGSRPRACGRSCCARGRSRAPRSAARRGRVAEHVAPAPGGQARVADHDAAGDRAVAVGVALGDHRHDRAGRRSPSV